MENLKDANLIQIFAAKNMPKRVRRNLIALASVNTIMFGAFMGAMNVMLLYSEVRVLHESPPANAQRRRLTCTVHLRLG